MRRLTTAWTERHVVVAAAMSAAALTGGMAGLSTAPYHLLGMAAVILTVAVSLPLNAFGGVSAGLLTTAALIAARQLGGQWTAADFGLALAMSVTMVLLGWLTGVVGSQLRTAPATGDRIASQTLAEAPAFGSLGLLGADRAMARLDEEVARARRHCRPLAVVLLNTEVIAPGLSEEERRAARRTVSRLVETLVPETAVPFALAPDEVGVILPETDASAAWELLGPVVDSAGRASFGIRDQDARRMLADCIELRAVIVELSPQVPDAERLVATARRAAVEDRVSWPRTGAMPG